MQIIAVFSPDWLVGSGQGTQFVPNPWGTPDAPASPVWIECTVPVIEVFDNPFLTMFGIIEIEYLDDNGQVQQQTFGDITNLDNVMPGDLPPRWYCPQLLSVTFAAVTYNASESATATLFLWG